MGAFSDYMCPICTSIAFKPVRLACGHVFCIRYADQISYSSSPWAHATSTRCLVKLQKRGLPQDEKCALCRAPNVFDADIGRPDLHLQVRGTATNFASPTSGNLDMALQRFMKDWFPRETLGKTEEDNNEKTVEFAAQMSTVLAGPPTPNHVDCRIV